MKRLLFLFAIICIAAAAFGQVYTAPATVVACQVCTLAQNKSCTTAAIDTRALGGFGFQMYDSVRNTLTGTIAVKGQGAYGTSLPSKSNKMWTATGFTDSLFISALSVTAAGKTGHYDKTDYIARVPYFRYIISNTGDSTFIWFYYLCNEN